MTLPVRIARHGRYTHSHGAGMCERKRIRIPGISFWFLPIPPALLTAGWNRQIEHDRVFKYPCEPPRRIVAQRHFKRGQLVHDLFHGDAIDDFNRADYRAVIGPNATFRVIQGGPCVFVRVVSCHFPKFCVKIVIPQNLFPGVDRYAAPNVRPPGAGFVMFQPGNGGVCIRLINSKCFHLSASLCPSSRSCILCATRCACCKAVCRLAGVFLRTRSQAVIMRICAIRGLTGTGAGAVLFRTLAAGLCLRHGPAPVLLRRCFFFFFAI